MPLLGGLLVNLFGGVVLWLSQWVTRKVAFGMTAVALMSSLTAGIFIVMRLVLGHLYAVGGTVPPVLAEAVALGVPAVAPLCVSSYITVWTACTVYAWQRDLMHVIAKV